MLKWTEGYSESERRALLAIVASLSLAVLIGVFFLIHFLAIHYYKPKYVKPVLKISPNDVVFISISPIDKKNPHKIIKSEYRVDKPETIKTICNMIHEAKTFNRKPPTREWAYLVTIKTETVSYSFVLYKSKIFSRNGMIISFHSNRTWGWTLGIYRADDLGLYIQNLVPEIHRRI